MVKPVAHCSSNGTEVYPLICEKSNRRGGLIPHSELIQIPVYPKLYDARIRFPDPSFWHYTLSQPLGQVVFGNALGHLAKAQGHVAPGHQRPAVGEAFSPQGFSCQVLNGLFI